MRVNQASLEVWFSPVERAERDTNMDRILHFFQSFTRDDLGWTACQVSKWLGMPILSVRPRLTQAVSEGKLTAEDGDVVYCDECKMNNQVYRKICGGRNV